MSDKYEKREYTKQEIEYATKYGEFISSFFLWKTIKEQKRRAEELENMTKNKND